MFTLILYILAFSGLLFSFLSNKKKTKQALMKAWKSFENILPQFLFILVLVGLILSIVDNQTITMLLGSNSGIIGVSIAAIIGSITLIPGFIAFPIASALLNNGAGITQIAAFVSTLMMVGIVTFPLEVKTFGKKATLIRNTLSFCFSIIVALIMGLVL